MPILSFHLVRKCIGIAAARWIAAIMVIHPLVVYHSAVAYGSEITSLSFILSGTDLSLAQSSANHRTGLMAGVVFGFVDGV